MSAAPTDTEETNEDRRDQLWEEWASQGLFDQGIRGFPPGTF